METISLQAVMTGPAKCGKQQVAKKYSHWKAIRM